jgi:hypothetical protein
VPPAGDRIAALNSGRASQSTNGLGSSLSLAHRVNLAPAPRLYGDGVGPQASGSSSAIRLAGWVLTRSSTSRRFARLRPDRHNSFDVDIGFQII